MLGLLPGAEQGDMSDKIKPRARGADSQPGQLFTTLAQGMEMLSA
jgi:hypothetical protein